MQVMPMVWSFVMLRPLMLVLAMAPATMSGQPSNNVAGPKPGATAPLALPPRRPPDLPPRPGPATAS